MLRRRQIKPLPGQLELVFYAPLDKRIARWCAAPIVSSECLLELKDDEINDYRCDSARSRRIQDECVVVIRDLPEGFYCLEHYLELPICKCGNAATTFFDDTKLPACRECYSEPISQEYLDYQFFLTAGMISSHADYNEPTNEGINSLEFYYACHNAEKKRKLKSKNLTNKKA